MKNITTKDDKCRYCKKYYGVGAPWIPPHLRPEFYMTEVCYSCGTIFNYLANHKEFDEKAVVRMVRDVTVWRVEKKLDGN